MYIRVYTCVYMYVYTCASVCTHMHICVCTCMYIYPLCVHARTCTSTQVCTYIYTLITVRTVVANPRTWAWPHHFKGTTDRKRGFLGPSLSCHSFTMWPQVPSCKMLSVTKSPCTCAPRGRGESVLPGGTCRGCTRSQRSARAWLTYWGSWKCLSSL